jgi:hypothetical protein
MVAADKWPALLKTVKKEDKTRTLCTWTGINPPDDEEKAVLARVGAEKKVAQVGEVDGQRQGARDGR